MVLERLESRSLKVCEKKFNVLTPEIEFFGNLVNHGNIQPHPKRADCIMKMPKPQTIADLQTSQNYQETIERRSNMEDSCNKLDRRGRNRIRATQWEWPDPCSTPIWQNIHGHQWCVWSRLPRYSWIDCRRSVKNHRLLFKVPHHGPTQLFCIRELIGIVMAVEQWKTYLIGKKFTVYTDHQPLTWHLNKRVHAKYWRDGWLDLLHANSKSCIRGKNNIVADALSRLQDEAEIDSNQENDYFDTQ